MKPLIKAGVLLPLLMAGGHAAQAADSLAPPPAAVRPGQAVPVTAHPDQQRLLASVDPALAENKQLVFDFWRHVMIGGKAEDAPLYMHAGYTEHNPLLPSGPYAFQEYVANRVRRNAVTATIPDLVTIVAEGPYVVLAFVSRYLEPGGTGNTYTSTHFELFRISGGLITEHWDSTRLRANERMPDYGEAQARPVVGISGSAQHSLLANADPALFANKRLAFDIARQVTDPGRDDLAELYIHPVYIQHSPHATLERGANMEYFARRPDDTIGTALAAPLVAMVAEGDLVVQVLAAEHLQNGVTYTVPAFDMYRIAGARAGEHWDSAAPGAEPPVMQRAAPRR